MMFKFKDFIQRRNEIKQEEIMSVRIYNKSLKKKVVVRLLKRACNVDY